jgi:hypothetical protein
VHLSNLQDVQWHIEQRRFGRHEDEVRRCQEYEKEYDNSNSALEPIPDHNTTDDGVDNPEGPPAFTRAL